MHHSTHTNLHTAMDVSARRLLKELDPTLVVTGCKDAYPHDRGFAAAALQPDAINHRADACVYDTDTGTRELIDFTFTCASLSSGKDGAQPGSHADAKDDDKVKQYAKDFPGFGPDSEPVSLVILSMERHGSWSKGTIAYWDARVKAAHDREVANMEFPTPLSVLTRRVRQTLAVALWRSNAVHIAQLYRKALHGAQRVGSKVATPAAGPGGGL